MSREAMKLALEALKNFEKAGLATLKTIDAITALKQALEQPEPEPIAWTDEDFTELIVSEDIAKEIGATVPLYTAPPKHEPEPVIDKSAAIRIATSLGWTPKRTWQGLTDEEIDEGQRQSWVDKQAFESAVWWAEAKLKEKNT